MSVAGMSKVGMSKARAISAGTCAGIAGPGIRNPHA